MTKLIVSLFFLLVCLNKPFAQVDNVTGQFVDKGNILQSPGAESGKKGWTNAAGTFTVESTGAIKGSRVFKVVLSSQTLNLYQDSTSYASQYADGIQGIAYAYVKTSISGIKLCSRQAGVTSTSLCVSHTGSGKWELLKIPYILGGTSNGLAIISGSAKTGTVYIDDTFVGAVDLSATQSFDTTCDTVACATEFSAKVSSTGVVSDENVDWINANCTKSGASSQAGSCTIPTGIFSATPNCTCTTSANSTADDTCDIVNGSSSGISIVYSTSQNGSPFSHHVNIICQKQGADYTAAIQAQKDYQKTKVSSYSSTNADTDWQSCGHTTSSFTGFGTVSAIETQCKRQGSDLLMKGKFTSGTPTSVEARMALPTWNGTQLVSAGSSVIPSLQLSGDLVRNYNSTTYFRNSVLIEPSVSYVTFGAQFSTLNALTKQTGANTLSSGEQASFTARIPIEGWQKSNIIIGQFNGLEKCESTLDCTDVVSVKVSAAGVVSDENVDWISGNASITDTSKYAFNLNAGIFSVRPNCSATMAADISGASQSAVIDITSNTAISVRTLSGGAKSAQPFTIICQKTGVDYLAKTALAVASSQNTRSPGVENVVTYNGFVSASSGSVTSCSAGSCVITGTATGNPTSSFVSTGKYSLNFPAGTFDGTSLVSCSFTCHQSGTSFINYDSALPLLSQADGSISLGSLGCIAISSTPARTNSAFSYICTGIKK